MSLSERLTPTQKRAIHTHLADDFAYLGMLFQTNDPDYLDVRVKLEYRAQRLAVELGFLPPSDGLDTGPQ